MVQTMFLWEECSWEEIKTLAEADAIVVVPTGSIEQHGPHLPVSTDTIIVSEISRRAAHKARKTIPTLLLPTIVYGTSPYHMKFPGTISLSDETYLALLTEIRTCVVQHGFRRLVFLNGHGGNIAALQLAIQRIHRTSRNPTLCVAATYWNFIREEVQACRHSSRGGISHAGEFETSALLWLHPKLVNTGCMEKNLPEIGDENFNYDWYSTSNISLGLQFTEFSPTGVLGDPSVARAKMGETMIGAAAKKIAEFIVRMGQWTIGPDTPNYM